jgi:hypothetical protein
MGYKNFMNTPGLKKITGSAYEKNCLIVADVTL